MQTQRQTDNGISICLSVSVSLSIPLSQTNPLHLCLYSSVCVALSEGLRISLSQFLLMSVCYSVCHLYTGIYQPITVGY